MRIGFHVSIRGNIDKAVDRAVSLSCNTFQFFTRTPRAWAARELNAKETRAFIKKVKITGMKPVFAHTPYLINLASAKPNIFLRSVDTLKEEMQRCRKLMVPYIVTHLGSHLGSGKRKGLERIAWAVNEALKEIPKGVMLLLENTSGGSNSMGGTFEDIQHIIQSLANPEQVGVCFDTSHAFAAGYNLKTRTAVEDTIRKFDSIIGFEKIRLIHLNDSLRRLGSRVDRHEHIGLGMIGKNGFRAILSSRLVELPLILETPKDFRRSDSDNLMAVKELAG